MAQERKKRRIVLTSLLKPIDDTRMFEKIGLSLANAGPYEVFIIGYPSVAQPTFSGVQFISLQPFPRLSFKRYLAKWQVFRIVRKLKPSILIFNTHELLWPAIMLKALTPVKLVYDVRENYYLNILHGGSFPRVVRVLLALSVRLKENILALLVDHFFLAESGYENEFGFHRRSWTVLENRASPQPSPVEERETSPRPSPAEARELPLSSAGEGPGVRRLLFSGTLAESTGVFRAIQLAKELNRLDSNISLTIVGYAAVKAVEEKILHEVGQNKFITLIGGSSLVPHPIILEQIQKADAGIIAYPPSPHTKNSIPTKLFEYLSSQLPIILEQYWPWIERFSSHQPFIFMDFENPDYPALLHSLKTQRFYHTAPNDVTWVSEEQKLLKAMNDL